MVHKWVFFVADIMSGDLATSTTFPYPVWDFSSLVGFRVGVELGF